MALDRIGLEMVAPRLRGAAVLCLGYPDITVPAQEVKRLLGVEPRKFTGHGGAHKVPHPLPETVDTLTLAGAAAVDCVDFAPARGCERVVDLNVRQDWPREYDLVVNPGTVEHCFDVAAAMFNAWRAAKVGGVVLHVAPANMVNHGFWNMSPTVFYDFCVANGGKVLRLAGADRGGAAVAVEPHKRFRLPSETVLYALLEKHAAAPERIPVQWRYRQ
jgi:hypothetical protein